MRDGIFACSEIQFFLQFWSAESHSRPILFVPPPPLFSPKALPASSFPVIFAAPVALSPLGWIVRQWGPNNFCSFVAPEDLGVLHKDRQSGAFSLQPLHRAAVAVHLLLKTLRLAV